MVAGIALATLYINMFCQAIYMGFNYHLATAISQAYGAYDHYLVGSILNKGRISVTLLFVDLLISKSCLFDSSCEQLGGW